MKVILINGSPRAKGCTFTALSEVAGVLSSSGIETEIIQLGKGPIQGCTACGGCANGKGRCVFDDAVNEVLAKMEAANGLIVGSPVYYAAPNGALVSFLNRLFYAGGGIMAFKPGAAVVSARRAGTTASLDVLGKYFQIAGMPIVPSQYWNMVHGTTPDEVRQDEEGLQIMRTLGRNMAWMLNCFAKGDVPPAREPGKRTNFIRV